MPILDVIALKALHGKHITKIEKGNALLFEEAD